MVSLESEPQNTPSFSALRRPEAPYSHIYGYSAPSRHAKTQANPSKSFLADAGLTGMAIRVKRDIEMTTNRGSDHAR